MKKKMLPNWRDVEDAFAEGMLSLLQQGETVTKIKTKRILEETGIHRNTWRSHTRDKAYLDRVMTDIEKYFFSRLSTGGTFFFKSTFLDCVVEKHVWFEIEFLRGSHVLFDKIMKRLEPIITEKWPPHQNQAYTLFCFELYNLLQDWNAYHFSEKYRATALDRYQKIDDAYRSGQRAEMTTVMFP